MESSKATTTRRNNVSVYVERGSLIIIKITSSFGLYTDVNGSPILGTMFMFKQASQSGYFLPLGTWASLVLKNVEPNI